MLADSLEALRERINTVKALRVYTVSLVNSKQEARKVLVDELRAEGVEPDLGILETRTELENRVKTLATELANTLTSTEDQLNKIQEQISK